MEAKKKKAIAAINQQGALLVFPINNRKDPMALWHCLHPRSQMRWEWDESGDNRVADLWHLREQLSTSRQVIYSKWYQNRATFFSKEVFLNILAAKQARALREKLSQHDAKNIMEALEMDSPLSTKQVKVAAELQGKNFESAYNRAMKELWVPGLIVAFGEVQDSSFPSLAVAATSQIFEDLWIESQDIPAPLALEFLQQKLGPKNLFFKFLMKGLALD